MMREKDEMSVRSWRIVLGSFALFLCGFVLLALVGRDYHGIKGFLPPFLLIGGLLGIIVGLVYHPADEG